MGGGRAGNRNRLGHGMFRAEGLGFRMWGLGFKGLGLGYSMLTFSPGSPRTGTSKKHTRSSCYAYLLGGSGALGKKDYNPYDPILRP